MARICPAIIGVLVLTTCLPSLLAAPSEVAPPEVKPTGLDTVLQRVADVVADDRWQQEGWRDPVIEGWLDHVITQLRTATGDEKLDLPVRFDQVKAQAAPPVLAGAAQGGGADAKVERDAAGDKAPATAPAPAAAARGPVVMKQDAGGNVVVIRGAAQVANKSLIVGRDIKMPHAMNAIILADGNAQVSFARNSLIIARGAVYVAHGENNVIVAGNFIHVSHDGSATIARNPNGPGFAVGPNGQPVREIRRPGSILLSGGALDISHASGSICAAKDSLTISHATACSFINPPADTKISNRTDSRDIPLDGLRIDPPPRGPTPRVQVDWMTPGRGVVVRFNDRRYVADVGKPITDETGQEVAGLAGWAVTFCDQGYVLFSKGREDFGVSVPQAE